MSTDSEGGHDDDLVFAEMQLPRGSHKRVPSQQLNASVTVVSYRLSGINAWLFLSSPSDIVAEPRRAGLA